MATFLESFIHSFLRLISVEIVKRNVLNMLILHRALSFIVTEALIQNLVLKIFFLALGSEFQHVLHHLREF